MDVILFGATGMVGQGVLRECLREDNVETLLAIGRRSTGVSHPKLSEHLLSNIFSFDTGDENLQHFDACFFCLGVSSAGMSEVDYRHMTLDLTIGWAQKLAKINPMMTFIYVSGAGTGGRSMWAQIKGKTESTLLELFPKAYMFRLAALQPMHGEVSRTRWTRVSYALLKPLIPVVRMLIPNSVITTEELGRAMIRVALQGPEKHVLENRDLIVLGKQT
jgi:aspartate-semialdehyde dehydrogenase